MKKKILGEERRKMILKWLMESDKPITGGELARRTNVTRQVIVGDINLLKAKNVPIIATSQGYLYIHNQPLPEKAERTIVCFHPPEQTEEELNILVDHGVTVKDVKIEHAVYGYISAPINVSTRKEVKQFVSKVNSAKAPYLLELTGGIHLHTIEADDEETLDEAEHALELAEILYKGQEEKK